MRRAVVIAIFICLIALSARLLFLDSIPSNLQPDAVDTLRTYIFAKQQGSIPWYGVNWNGAPAINTYLIGGSWEIFQQSFWGIRFPSAILSTVSILLMFYLGYTITKKAVLTGAFALTLSTNTWFLNFSRSGWENVFNAVSLMLVVLGIYTFFQKKHYRNALIYLISGSVLGFYFYHPGKLLLPVTMSILVIGSILSRRFTKEGKWLLLYITVTVLLILPHFWYILSHPAKSMDRLKTVSLMQNNGSISYATHIKKNSIGPFTFQKELFMHDNWSRYISSDEHPIHPLITLFFLVGFIISVMKHPYFPLLYIATILPIGLLSMQTPNAARTVHVVPFVFLLAAIGCGTLIDSVSSLMQKHTRIVTVSATGIISTILIVLSMYQFQWYWEWIQRPDVLQSRQPALSSEEFPEWLQYYKGELKLGRNPSVSDWHAARE